MNSSTSTITSSKQQLSPLVYWAQTEDQITLKVELKDSKQPNVRFDEKSIKFNTYGLGARGLNEYQFTLNLFAKIDDDDSNFKVFDSKIEFTIRKQDPAWWPRLIATPQKPHWLKIDFDRWRTEDDVIDEDEPRDVMEDYSSASRKLHLEELGYIKESGKKVYMVFYNLCQFVGYTYVLLVMSVLYYRDGPDSMSTVYEFVGNPLKFCQLLQYLEVLHPIFGYTKGGPLIPFFQVTGRNFVLFLMITLEPRMQTKPVVFYVFCIWSLVEVVRYPYYISQMFESNIGLLTWLRYTIWIPLYPMGILCEGIIILRNIPYFEETKRLSVEMPNKWNFAFDMPSFLKVYLIVLVLPGTYLLMTYMAKARAKKLGGGRSSGSSGGGGKKIHSN
ncbi:very-long-chain (3R)-3-hydroxyacyl-CoA dehydratase [Episyrphus balteatus]|uniref:very-long-chain (3R)-3-hydroxyacyl-CoA dehydratase n=1 Tax=Episyrphus balteatus TaxID=286459 RepID=UPI0024855D8E|nr:very-long-chain (3R)-3-hydroxyacyl-CoA dehydratase [Episyrphus balteatus]